MRARVSFALVAALFVLAPAASAQDPRKAEAERFFKAGLEAHDRNDEEAALAEFKKAYDVYPSPNALFEIGRTEKLLGKRLAALRHLRAAMKNDLLHPKNQELAKQAIAELERHLARVEVVGPPGTKVAVADLEITLPAEPIDVEPGPCLATATIDGARVERKVVAQAARTARLELAGDGTAPPPPPPPQGHDARPRSTEIEPTSSTKWLVSGSFAAAGVGGLVLGAVFLAQGNSAFDEASGLRYPSGGCGGSTDPACARGKELRSDRDSAATLSSVGFVVGGVFLAASIATLVLWPKATAARSSTSSLASPLLLPFTGRF